jgi:hypothetical protein
LVRPGQLTALGHRLGHNASSEFIPFAPHAYCADLLSTPGMSGSPVFALIPSALAFDLASGPRLFGLLVAHLPHHANPKSIIIPSTYIRQAILAAS